MNHPLRVLSITLMIVVGLLLALGPTALHVKDMERAPKVVAQIQTEITLKSIDIIEKYIPSAYKRDHLIYIPEGTYTYTLSGDTISGPLWDDIVKAVEEYDKTRNDIQNLSVEFITFHPGSYSADELKVNSQTSPYIEFYVKGEAVQLITHDNHETFPFKVKISVHSKHAGEN